MIEWASDTWTSSADWECEGYDRPIYTNMFYPFPLDPPRALRRGVWTANDGGGAAAPAADSGQQEHGGDVSLIGGWKWDPEASDPNELENPTGCYRRSFDVPETWTADGRRVFLVFEARGDDALRFNHRFSALNSLT